MPTSTLYYPFLINGEYPCYHPGPIHSHWREAADRKGFVVLGRGGEGHQTLVLGCRRCGEPLLRRTNVVLGSRIECKTCVQQPYEAAAARFGAERVGPDPQGDRHYALWRLECRHIVRLQYGQIQKIGQGEVEADCIDCRTARYGDEAKVHGWKLLHVIPDKQGFHTYRHECGHAQEIATANMRTGECACASCSPGASSRPSFIYLFRIDLPNLPVIKLGYSQRPRKRLRHQLAISSQVSTDILRLVPMPTGFRARIEETAIHRKLATHHPEWIVPKTVFGDAIGTKGEVYRPAALPDIERLLDEVASRYPPEPIPD